MPSWVGCIFSYVFGLPLDFNQVPCIYEYVLYVGNVVRFLHKGFLYLCFTSLILFAHDYMVCKCFASDDSDTYIPSPILQKRKKGDDAENLSCLKLKVVTSPRADHLGVSPQPIAVERCRK